MTNYAQRADQVTIAVNVVTDVTVDTHFSDRTLYPLRRSRFSMPGYRLRAGFPEPIPPFDVRSISHATLSGATVTNTRPSPLQVAPTSVARWLPTDATYDGLVWDAIAGGTRTLETSALFAPTLTHDFHYYVGKELVTRDALMFSTASKQFLWTNFTPSTEDEWTMMLVACPLPPRRNALGMSDFYGVLGYDGVDQFGLRQYATAIKYYQGAMANTTNLALGSQAPAIYAISATSTTIRFYRRSLGVTWKITLDRTGGTGDYTMDMLIGCDVGTAQDYTANMALMEVNFYNTRLDDDAFELEASNVYSAYGNYAGVS